MKKVEDAYKYLCRVHDTSASRINDDFDVDTYIALIQALTPIVRDYRAMSSMYLFFLPSIYSSTSINFAKCYNKRILFHLTTVEDLLVDSHLKNVIFSFVILGHV